MLTKVEAIKKTIEENGGIATWGVIYNNIEKYYPSAKISGEWEAGIRGVLYREIKKGRNFKKVGLGIFALKDYKEEKKPEATEKIRMHSFIQGICIELGNFKGFQTYTPDQSVVFKDGVRLFEITSLTKIPEFTYTKIIREVKRIDVIWFNKAGFLFPQRAFEVVDSIGTLAKALNRNLQLSNFNAEFFIVGPEKHKSTFKQQIELAPYLHHQDRFKFIEYEKLIKLYENAIKTNEMETKIFSPTTPLNKLFLHRNSF